MADRRDTDSTHAARADRRDTALVAQYLHELSERHGRSERDLSDSEADGSGEWE